MMSQSTSSGGSTDTEEISYTRIDSLDASARPLQTPEKEGLQKFSVELETDTAGAVPSNYGNKDSDSERTDNSGSPSLESPTTSMAASPVASEEGKFDEDEDEDDEFHMMDIDDGVKSEMNNDYFALSPIREPEAEFENEFGLNDFELGVAAELDIALGISTSLDVTALDEYGDDDISDDTEVSSGEPLKVLESSYTQRDNQVDMSDLEPSEQSSNEDNNDSISDSFWFKATNGEDEDDPDTKSITSELALRPKIILRVLGNDQSTAAFGRKKVAGEEPKAFRQAPVCGKIAGKQPKNPPEIRRRKIAGKEPKVPPEVTLAKSKIASNPPVEAKGKGKVKGKGRDKAVTATGVSSLIATKIIRKTPKGRAGTRTTLTSESASAALAVALSTPNRRETRASCRKIAEKQTVAQQSTQSSTPLSDYGSDLLEYKPLNFQKAGTKFPTHVTPHVTPKSMANARIKKWITFKFGSKTADRLRMFDFSENRPPSKFDMPSPTSSDESDNIKTKITTSRPSQILRLEAFESDSESGEGYPGITTLVPEVQATLQEYQHAYEQEEEEEEEQSKEYENESPDPMLINSTLASDEEEEEADDYVMEEADDYVMEAAYPISAKYTPDFENSEEEEAEEYISPAVSSVVSEDEDLDMDRPSNSSRFSGSPSSAIPIKGDFIPMNHLLTLLQIAEEIERDADAIRASRLDTIGEQLHIESCSCIIIINDMIKRRENRAQRQREVEIDEANEEREADVPCSPELRAKRAGHRKRQFEHGLGADGREVKRRMAEQRGMGYCGRCKKERDLSDFDGEHLTCIPCLQTRRLCDQKFRNRR